MPQSVETQSEAPSERLPEEEKIRNELVMQIGKPIGPTAEEIQRIKQFPSRNYSEIVEKYEELLTCLKERMRYVIYGLPKHLTKLSSETTEPVDKILHPTITKATDSRQMASNGDAARSNVMDFAKIPDGGQASHEYISSSSLSDKPVFYRVFADRQINPQERDEDDIRGSGRLNRLYCHDASPYVYRGPFRIEDDQIEVEKWKVKLQIIGLEQHLIAYAQHLLALRKRLEELTTK